MAIFLSIIIVLLLIVTVAQFVWLRKQDKKIETLKGTFVSYLDKLDQENERLKKKHTDKRHKLTTQSPHPL